MERALLRLRKAVASVPQDQRRGVLQCFPCRVRLALLGYMESANSLSAKACCGNTAGTVRQVTAARGAMDFAPRHACTAVVHRISEAKGKKRCTDCTASGTVPERNLTVDIRPESSPQCAVSQPAVAQLELTFPHPVWVGQRGVTKMGKHLFRAHAFFLNIRIITACVPALQLAIKFHRVLQQVKQEVFQASEAALYNGLLQRAVAAACHEHSVDVEDVGLVYRAEVRAMTLVNRDIWGRYSKDLERVLAERKLLLEGKAAGWPNLRAAWILVLQAPVLTRGGAPPGWARHPRFDEASATSFVDAAWEAGAPRREVAKDRRLRQQLRKMSSGQDHKQPRSARCRASASQQARAQTTMRAVMAVERALAAEDRLRCRRALPTDAF